MDIKFVWLVRVLICFVPLLILIMEALRRRACREKVRRMEPLQKIRRLNELAEPFGFFYIAEEDVFSSLVDAWQRKRGYEASYDTAAAGANMVLDAFPVYFDYAEKTWLIEFWKGQYGINTGGEVGVYHAKKIVPACFYETTHFDAAGNDEMPGIRCRLERNGVEVYDIFDWHWWLTGFHMGTFSKPSELRMITEISFDEEEMAQSFWEGLRKAGYPENKYRICCKEAYVRIDFEQKHSVWSRLHRTGVQWVNRFFCGCYWFVTKPFTDTLDRMLFLYELLPFCFRQMLCLGTGRFYKRYRRADRWRR